MYPQNITSGVQTLRASLAALLCTPILIVVALSVIAMVMVEYGDQ